MKNISAGKKAFIISIILALLSAVIIGFGIRASMDWAALIIPGSFFIVFFTSWFLVYYSIRNTDIDAPTTIEDLRGESFGNIESSNGEIKKLRKVEKYRKEFIGNVSHELKTPIFNIQGYILTLLEGGLEDQEINRRYLERTEKSINRMISIVEDLESITKLETGELKLNLGDFDIVSLVKEVFEMLETKRLKFNINLLFDKKYNKPIMVNGDQKRILEVLNNLILNSLNYGSKGGETRVSFKEDKDLVLITVSDNGIGIDKSDLPRIFERFYRTDRSRSRERGGTGLGLSIVKHIIEAHKQTISVKSKLNSGTRFTFTLQKA